MASTKWGDKPMSLSMSHDGSSIRSAASQFLSVPLSHSTPIPPQRKTVLLKFMIGDDLVTVQGALAPFDEYWYDNQPLLAQAVEMLASEDRLRHFEHYEKFLLKKGHQITEIMNRLRLFFTDVLKVKMEADALPALAQYLMLGDLEAVSTDHPPDACVPVTSKIVTKQQTIAKSPGRLDEEEYNVIRSRFLTHEVFDLTSDLPGVQPFMDMYYATVPRADSTGWCAYRRKGLLIHAPNEQFSDLTIFSTRLTASRELQLMAGDVVVACFDLMDVSDVAPSHHASVQEERTIGTSRYSNVTANDHPLVFFSPSALRWAIDHACTDSLVSTRNIRVCVGIDPLVTRWTRDGVQEAAILMDDKLPSVGRARMALRTLLLARRSPMTSFLLGALRQSGGQLIEHYRCDAANRYGSPTVPTSHPPPCSKCPELKEQIAKLSSSPIPKLNSTAGPAVLLSKIADLQRANRELALKLVDVQPAREDHLLAYLDEHVCVNAKDHEKDLLARCNVSSDSISSILGQRAKNRERFETRLRQEASAEWEPRVEALSRELAEARVEQQDMMTQSLQYLNERDELLHEVDELKRELATLRSANVRLNADNHRMSRATRVGNAFVSDVELLPSGIPGESKPSMEELVDDL
nr:muNS [Avian orthoreovirus]WPM03548.1 muNS [Avian orthoreovirus]WPM03560.1 muNS [Avian orthoreovirus]WPM03572.1 muNS [Avian orthoreovirus]WPM03584.1 muNS [Avian orthoreovirus]